jgi:hypothetical protein
MIPQKPNDSRDLMTPYRPWMQHTCIHMGKMACVRASRPGLVAVHAVAAVWRGPRGWRGDPRSSPNAGGQGCNPLVGTGAGPRGRTALGKRSR